MPRHPVPAVIVCGLHATARKRTMCSLLVRVPGAIAVHHRPGPAHPGVMMRTVRTHRRILERLPIELGHGSGHEGDACLSCGTREDLLPLLVALAGQHNPPLLVVELWDALEPRAVAEALVHGEAGGRPVADSVRLADVIAGIDGARLHEDLESIEDLAERGLGTGPGDGRTVAGTLARQIEYATVHDVTEHAVAGLPDLQSEALLAALNPVAVPLSALWAAAAATSQVRSAARTDPVLGLVPPDGTREGVTIVTWRRLRPSHPQRLHTALEDIAPAALRSRGRIWLANRCHTALSWDCAGGALIVEEAGPWLASLDKAAWDAQPPQRQVAAALQWNPYVGDRSQLITFTGIDLDGEALIGRLDRCLLTDAEMVAGSPSWAALADPFAPFLGPVA